MNKPILYLFIAALLFNVWQYGFWASDRKNDQKKFDIVNKQYKKAKDSIVALNESLNEANYFTYDLNILLPYIKEQINTLNDQPKGNPLVPLDPIDGNKFVINKIKFVNHRWIIGDFSNGEIWGEVIIKYFINQDKTVSFETAESVIYSN